MILDGWDFRFERRECAIRQKSFPQDLLDRVCAHGALTICTTFIRSLCNNNIHTNEEGYYLPCYNPPK